MVRRFVLVVVIALLSASASAQRGPCAGGGGPNPMFTVSTGNPVVLTFQHATTSSTFTTPVVTIKGNHITVVQVVLVPPGQFPLPVPFPVCNRQAISLGALPPGSYTVSWGYQHPPSQALQTFNFAFAVPSAVPPAAVAAPCTAPPPVYTVRLSVGPSREPGTFQLHYENSMLAYVPQFGTPVVSAIGGQITITQPVTDVADAGQPGSPPPTVICNSADVELGPLGAGTYHVSLLYPLTVGGVDHGLQSGGGGGFILDAHANVQCSTTRSFVLVSPPMRGSPLTVSSTVMIAGSFLGTQVARDGNTFTVTDTTSTEFPGVHVPYCLTTSAILGALPPGSYTVEWKVNDFGVPRPEAGGSFSFKIATQARRRASAR